MPSDRTLHVLVVGQGLAGSLLALALQARGARVETVDEDRAATASRITPGIASPLAGPRLTPPPAGPDAARASMRQWYALQQTLGTPLIRPRTLIRAVDLRAKLPETLGRYRQRRHHTSPAEGLPETVGRWFGPGAHDGVVADPAGSYELHGAVVDVPALLSAVQARQRADGIRHTARVEPADVAPAPDAGAPGATWNGHRYDRIVFCDGAWGRDNLWLTDQGLKPVGGEILTLSIKGGRVPAPTTVLHRRGGWLAPEPQTGLWRLGTTQRPGEMEPMPTPHGRDELLARMPHLLARPGHVQIHAHVAAARPGIERGRPVIGDLPHAPGLSVFNGLGGRGVLQAPALAEALADALVHGTPVPEAWQA